MRIKKKNKNKGSEYMAEDKELKKAEEKEAAAVEKENTELPEVEENVSEEKNEEDPKDAKISELEAKVKELVR